MIALMPKRPVKKISTTRTKKMRRARIAAQRQRHIPLAARARDTRYVGLTLKAGDSVALMPPQVRVARTVWLNPPAGSYWMAVGMRLPPATRTLR
jgi:hypothetical protein